MVLDMSQKGAGEKWDMGEVRGVPVRLPPVSVFLWAGRVRFVYHVDYE